MNSPPAYTGLVGGGAPSGFQPYYCPPGPAPVYVGNPQQPYPYEKPPTRVYENYRSEQSRGLGVLMIVDGILCIIFNIVSLVLGSLLSVVGYGIWGGIWFIITGSFGVSASKARTPCHVVTFMVLSIIACAMSLCLLIMGTIAAILSAESDYDCGYSYNYGYEYSSSICQTIIAMEAMQAILAFIVGIASIWGSVLCCKVACCCNTTVQQQQQGGQYIQHPGTYPAPMYSGYPAPIMMNNTPIGVANSGYMNHSMNPTTPSVNDPTSVHFGTSNPHGGFHTAADIVIYENNKG